MLVQFNYEHDEDYHGRDKRGLRDLRDYLRRRFRKRTGASSVGLTVKLDSGQQVELELKKKKTIAPTIDMWGMKNSVPV